MEFQNLDTLLRKLLQLSKVEASKKLGEFYAKARFRISADDFSRQWTDGADDGGIDFFHREDSTFFIFQLKFSGQPRQMGETEIFDELKKLKNTLTGENPNRRATDFVNGLRRETAAKASFLEILWITTNVASPSLRDKVQQDLDAWRKDAGWGMEIDFVIVDKNALESVIYDVQHGYVPYTGKKSLRLENGQWTETHWGDTGIYSVLCTIELNDILKWFQDTDDIDKYLQKNVREFLGDTSEINKAIGKSYLQDPAWFWYKHNGIIIFADSITIDRGQSSLILRNPQVVNGGQTLKSVFLVYDKNQRPDNPAKALLRAYRLPYEDTKTYQRSIEIISALNSQNKINASDLRSTDPRQVRLENLFLRMDEGYKYHRKRSKEAKSAKFAITMRNLALRYYVCRKRAPHEGVRGNVEEIFEEPSKYNETFDETAISRDLGSNHVAINYVTVWNLDRILQDLKSSLPEGDKSHFTYTKWFVLADSYEKLLNWKQQKFKDSWTQWIQFVESLELEKAVSEYGRKNFRILRELLPDEDEPRAYLRTTEATRDFTQRTSVRSFDLEVSAAYTRYQARNA